MDEIAKLKAQLYLELAKKTEKELTENEVDILFLLSKDNDIQQALQNNLTNS
jgi:sirohydrochlorin ferrochelatase